MPKWDYTTVESFKVMDVDAYCKLGEEEWELVTVCIDPNGVYREPGQRAEIQPFYTAIFKRLLPDTACVEQKGG